MPTHASPPRSATKLLAIFRFELAHQLRRPWPWLAMAALAVFALVTTRVAIVPVTLPQDFVLNSPFIITAVSVIACQLWLLLASAVAGDAAARDAHTGMHALLYPCPLRRGEYLGGRFLAALALNALILLAVQAGSLLAVYGPGANANLVGPFRPGAYLAAYVYVGLTNACIATAFQFAAALASGRPIAGYVGSLALFFLSYPVTFALYLAGLGKRALLADPIGVLAIMNEMMSEWTIAEKNVRAFTLQGPMLANRLLWLGVASAVLALACARFRFAHRAEGTGGAERSFGLRPTEPAPPAPSRPARDVVPKFGLATRARQTLAIAAQSFATLARTPAGVFLLAGFPGFLVLVLLNELEMWGIPLLPRTGFLLSKHMTAPLTEAADYRVMVPLLIAYFAGELVWRERDARVAECVDATPTPEWALFLGKLLGLTLLLVALMGGMTAAGVTVQLVRGFHDFELGRYAQILLGLQLPEYLLFAVLALLVHTVANHKYVGLLATLVVYLLLVTAPFLGVERRMLVYSSGPAWFYTDMRGFADSVRPWLWFKLYWAGWAALLAVATRLLWVRGVETRLGVRLRLARGRFDRSTRLAAVGGAALALATGAVIVYNTEVLNARVTEGERTERRAAYERRYGRYEGVPQPSRAHTSLRIDIDPAARRATVRGSYRLVNRAATAIDAIHVEPAFYAETHVTFDRPARRTVADRRLGHDVYVLASPLRPGDSLEMRFDVRLQRRGFDDAGPRASGAGAAVAANGTWFTSGALPLIGYQPARELWSAEERRRYGLPRQVTLPAPGDIDPSIAVGGAGTFDAVVSTALDQTAVAPGELRRTWTERGRRWFHYVGDAPLPGTDVFASARYRVHRERHRGVDLQVYLHPGHTKHLARVLRGARAALDYYSAQFGPYPQRFLQIVEQPGNFLGMGVDGAGVLTGGEAFFLLDPSGDGFDGMFEVVAHEMGHQWWGVQLHPAVAEGAGVISEGLAWYSAMQLVKHEKGREALRRFMRTMREPNPWPPIRTGLPLLRAMDPWAAYRKAPYALHALSEYVGEDRVNLALRRLLARKSSSLATTLDLYGELQAVTPDSLRPLLRDLFAANAFWTFDTHAATATRAADGAWRVTLDVEAHETVADSLGREREVPLAAWVEIGVFGAPRNGRPGLPLYVRRHRVRSGRQTIVVTVPERPARAGIDPYGLLDWAEGDHLRAVELGGR